MNMNTAPTPYYEDEHVTLYCGDCRDILPTLEPANLVLTDPPYGIGDGAAFMRNNMSVIANWDTAGHNKLVDDWLSAVTTTTDAVLVEFMSGALETEDRVRAGHVAAGWTPWRRYLIVKTAPPPTARPTFVSAWEAALVSYRGKRQWHGSGYVPDRWIGNTPNRLRKGHGHPTQKPLEPMQELVRALSAPGGLVLDPFAGSGTSLVAAVTEGRRAVGIELDENYCRIAVERLRAIQPHLNGLRAA